MGKNIVLFVDGTRNNGLSDPPGQATNVWKMHKLCEEQCQKYQAGVATNVLAIGALTGFGTKKRLKGAYRFLTDNYKQGDHIFLLGFSRGAFAVRLFAGFLGYAGTIFGSALYEDYLPHIYRIYEGSIILNTISAFRQYLLRFGETTPLPIHFLGVWDTVEEYWPQRDLPEIQSLPRHITHARHALAIHERRGEMQPTLWTKWDSTTSTVKQVWFPGAHADVGGGYGDSKLSEAPLQWMRDQAHECGLAITPVERTERTPILHQERTGGNVVSGNIVSWFRHERIRTALSDFSEVQLLTSMGVDQTACAHLLKPHTKVQCPSYFTTDQRQEAENKVHEADTKALQLVLRLKASQPAPDWISKLTFEDAASCEAKCEMFLSNLHNSGISQDDFSICLFLMILLEADTAPICTALDNFVNEQLRTVDGALDLFEQRFSGFRVALPQPLEYCIKKLRDRVSVKNEQSIQNAVREGTKLGRQIRAAFARRKPSPQKPDE